MDKTPSAGRIMLGSATELLGYTICGPAPLGIVHLQAKEGPSVLYGLNGGGKMALLRAMQNALLGRRPTDGVEAYLHVRIDPSFENRGGEDLIAERLFNSFGSRNARYDAEGDTR